MGAYRGRGASQGGHDTENVGGGGPLEVECAWDGVRDAWDELREEFPWEDRPGVRAFGDGASDWPGRA